MENMTTWRDDEETILDSDIWGVAKNLTPYASPEEGLEAWRNAVRVLDGLCTMADGLMIDSLILALVDAKDRAEEELERARERTRRPAGELTEYEEDTLRDLLRRSDALGNAHTAMLAMNPQDEAGHQEELEILDEMRKDVDDQFLRYMRGVDCLTSRKPTGLGSFGAPAPVIVCPRCYG